MQLALPESVNLFFLNFSRRTRYRGALAAILGLVPLSPALAGTLWIGGTPSPAITVPANYYFRPWITGSDKATAKFSISNKPAWATFDPVTGTLSGKVYAPNVGTYSNITISAKSATTSARMPSFKIVVMRGPTIWGAPSSTTIAVGHAFSFQPGAYDSAGRTLTFSVNTKPAWASFDTTTGKLFGTPGAVNVGTTSNIIITAKDGVASASLKPFSLTVVQSGNGSATVSWMPPTTDVNGNVLKGLAGYQIKYGTSSTNLSRTVQVTNAGLTRYVITGLTPATWYFGVAAYTSSGAQSNLSKLATKTIK